MLPAATDGPISAGFIGDQVTMPVGVVGVMGGVGGRRGAETREAELGSRRFEFGKVRVSGRYECDILSSARSARSAR